MQLEIEEHERQLILMALAHLVTKKPGWEEYIKRVASKMDDDHLTLFHEFEATLVRQDSKGKPQ